MIVSIIIPIYNVEKYLQRCIESAVRQTYRDIEIILVDDGSTDKSGEYCDLWSKKDSRIKVIHKTNGGLSVARNIGYDIATGDYILHLDSDDYLSSDCVSKALKMCKRTGADIAIMQMLYISEDTNNEIHLNEKEFVKVLSSEEAIEASLYQRLFSCCAPAKLYKKEIIEGIKFPEGKVSEDLATCHLFLDKANKITYTNAVGYYYRQHDNSIMHIFNSKRMDALVWALEIENFCKTKYPAILVAAKCRTFNVAVHLILDLPESGEEHERYYEDIWKEVKRTRIQTVLSKKARYREKAAALLSFGGEKILKRVWNSKFAVKRK